MVEIRPIEAGEAESFLRLLCRVFELDFKRAESIFYNEPLYDLGRKWALFDDGAMASILTTVPLTFGWGAAFGIAGVATEPERRGKGLASQLLLEVIDRSKAWNETGALLFAKDPRVYEKIGFKTIDDVVRGKVVDRRPQEHHKPLSLDEVEAAYGRWAEGDPNRLRRDALRWRYWRWNLRVCTQVDGGYSCVEGTTVRELVADPPPAFGWNLGPHVEWLGLRSMASRLELELDSPTVELRFMAHGVAEPPQLFLTDQF